MNQKCLWDSKGLIRQRPGATQGSEDLVCSLIANTVRTDETIWFDHPSLNVLREEKILNIILIDDSIGSGKRIKKYIQTMMSSKTFKSWWSGGFIKFHIVTFARTLESEQLIINSIPGEDHQNRIHPKSSKVEFISHIVYSKNRLDYRWGQHYKDILELCDSQKKIPKDRRRGYGDVMGNIVFEHSVPNNIPGVLWRKQDVVKPLFPNRTLANWITKLLKGPVQLTPKDVNTKVNRGILKLPSEMIELILLIKQGVRQTTTLAFRQEFDLKYTASILKDAINLGLVSQSIYITEAGITALKRYAQTANISADKTNRLIYIPDSWYSDQASVQLPIQSEDILFDQVDPAEASAPAGGDVR